MIFISRAIPVVSVATFLAGGQIANSQIRLPNLFPFPNGSGILETDNTAAGGQIDFSGPFFRSLGTNGRSCFSCHRPDQGWTISAQATQVLFTLTGGTDPIFRTVDGSNCDHNIDTSSFSGRRNAYSLLTSRGLIRVAMAVPAGAEYQVVSVSNSYGCSDAGTISTYRRPLPATNLRFLTTVMWDGRESTPPSTQKIAYETNPADLLADLAHQAMDAVAATPRGQRPFRPICSNRLSISKLTFSPRRHMTTWPVR